MRDFFLRKNFIFFRRKFDFQFFDPPPSIDSVLKDLKTKPARHWEKMGEEMVLRLFKFTFDTVPAYRKLLREERIQGEKIQTLEDFKKLPVIDKDYYLKRFKSAELFPNKDLSRATTFSATSGSTGEPFYFPRSEEQDWQYQYVAELFLKNQWDIGKKKTLGIIGFGLGIWIGGIFTYKNFNRIAGKGYNLALVPVGANIETYLRVIHRFGHLYDQVILMGYPPFVKDVIDEAKDYGVDWKKYNLRIMTAAEGYSEKFRDYLAEKTGLKNVLVDTLNIYGTVELGTMAHETPLTNLIRRIAMQKPEVFKELFPQANRIPTLAQYHPYIIHFEEVKGEVLASGFGSLIPLLRYRFPDMGGVIPFDTMIEKLQKMGVDIKREAEKARVAGMIMKLPFVYVYDRSDHAIILRGANIYAEEIKNALQDKIFENLITGKFTMVKQESKQMNGYLEINVELKKKTIRSPELKAKIQSTVVEHLRKSNSEYNDQYNSVPEMVTPKIILWPYQHHKYFKPGGKQKWTIKNS